MQQRLFSWLRSFVPSPQNTLPKEWLRAAIGVGLAMLLVIFTGVWLLGVSVTLHLAAPVGASAVLLIAASSSPFAQPWSIIGGNLIATLIGVSLARSGLDPVWSPVLSACLTLVCGFALRCLHPPSCALAMLGTIGGQGITELGYGLLAPVLGASFLLLGVALPYNNLTRRPYPRPRKVQEEADHAPNPPLDEHMSFTDDDVDRALKEFGEYVDITRDDLQQLIRQTEKHALRRVMGEVRAADIMSGELYWSTPEASIEQGWKIVRAHQLRALPILERDSQRLLGIVTQADLLEHVEPSRPRRLSLRRLRHAGTPLRTIMTSPVVSVTPGVHMVELVHLLAERGLHSLPVVDGEQRLVGMITQADLIAALYRIWLRQLPD